MYLCIFNPFDLDCPSIRKQVAMTNQRRLIFALAAIVLPSLLSVPSASAQAPSTGPTTAVLVSLTVKPGIERQQVTQLMPEEVKETVKLYLNGKIQQWYARSDGHGVVFIFNCGTVDEAKDLMASLPLAKANLVNLDFTALGPLQPLRYLLAEPAKPSPDATQQH